jgi:serine phosphatase RsbU (regulator of sigma subunit)
MDYRALLRNVEQTLTAVERGENVSSTIVGVAEAVVRNFRRELGIFGGRLYVRRDNRYELERGFGRSRKVPAGISVPADYGPIRRAEEDGLVVTDLSDPSVDRQFEHRLGVQRFAAISFGEERLLLSFDVHPRVKAEDLLLALGIIRTVVDSKVRTEKLEGLIDEARRIQQSILPKSVPAVGDYDIAGISRPADAVGGDFYDFLPLGEQSFGAAIADASGHGLLAALLVRDIYVGLRMGIGGDLKIARTIERLNRILNKSRLTTKFVSLFYGEFETNGDVVYVNAGHPAPLHLHAVGHSFTELASTGLVLGPSPDAVYSRRAIRMEPGDVLLLYTDGIVEAHDPRGREFGVPRVKRLLVELRKKPARETGERLLEAVRSWSCGLPPEDDRTVVVIRRQPARGTGRSLSGELRTFPSVSGTTPQSPSGLPSGRSGP